MSTVDILMGLIVCASVEFMRARLVRQVVTARRLDEQVVPAESESREAGRKSGFSHRGWREHGPREVEHS